MKISKNEAESFVKHHVEMFDYFGEEGEEADILRLSTDKGHLQEYSNEECTFFFYVIEGEGTFYLDGQPEVVESEDLVVAPPETRIFYLGDMELLLVSSPPWSPDQEKHHRYVDENGDTVSEDERE